MLINKHKTSTRLLRSTISFVLIIAMLVTASLREYGPIAAQAVEDESVTYVSDVRLFYSLESLEDAERLCEEKGYTPVKDGNLNKGTDRDYVVMGYMETDNKEEAVTDIRLLPMNSGYEMRDYKKLKDEYKKSNTATIDAIEAAATEFAANYKAGSPKAIEAYNGLNLIDVPEAGDMKLGDYIVEGLADWDFYANIMVISSTGTVNAILQYLSLGLAAYENEIDQYTGEAISVSWADGVENSIVWEELEEATTRDEYDELYREYGDDAKALHKELQTFATNYDNALATFDAAEYEAEQNALEGKSEEEIIEEKEQPSENDQGAFYLGIYDELEKHRANEDMNLGEYLLEIGYETTGDVDLTKLYPVLDSMSYAQRKMATMGGMSVLATTAGENTANDQIEEATSKTAEKIKSLSGKSSYSVWMNGNGDIMEKKVAYTSDAIRTNAAQKIADSQKYDDTIDNFQSTMNWVNLALGLLWCVLLVTKLVTSYICAAAGVGLSAFLSVSTSTLVSFAISNALAGPVGYIALAVLVLAMIVVWVWSAIRKAIKENSDSKYEEEPEYAADLTEINGEKQLIFYKGVGSDQSFDDSGNEAGGMYNRGIHGTKGTGDVNGRMGFNGWNLMFFSKDTGVGAPIIIRNGECPFSIRYGDDGSGYVKGYDSVKAFGEIMPENCNYLMKEEEKNAVYIHYRTEKSILNETTTPDAATGSAVSAGEDSESTTQHGLYYEDIIVRSADTATAAKAKLTKKGYKIWDVNLAGDVRMNNSRYKEWAYTYLGFKTTTDAASAITDIRVATFTNSGNMFYGSVSYGCAGTLGFIAENTEEHKDYPKDLDGLWFTTDKRAGTPIEVGGLHSVADHADGKYADKGWIPITTFSGVPYNFASTRDSDTASVKPGRQGTFGYRYTGYVATGDHEWNSKAIYLYYEPLEKYTSGTKYLSSVFFTFGVDNESTAAKIGEVETNYTELVDRMKKTPNTVVVDGNLASSYYYKGFITESNQKYLNLGYSWSYSPYRAITDIRIFQGTHYSSELPIGISKSVAISGSGKTEAVHYDAASVIHQRVGYDQKNVMRGIGPENAYMAPNGLDGTNDQVKLGYTSYQPGGYDYSMKKMAFIATGLYVSGPVDGMEKLTLDDVIISETAHTAVNNDGVITADVSGEKTLGGMDAQGDFNSIQEMKRPHELEPFNIAYPEWTNDNGDHMDAATPLYIYIRKPGTKKKYISSVSVGSYYFEKSKLEKGFDNNQEAAKITDMYAMIESISKATDEMIPANVAIPKGGTWYGADFKDEKTAMEDSLGGAYATEYDGNHLDADCLPWGPAYVEYTTTDTGEDVSTEEPVDRPAAYISVSRTDDESQAITGILLYKEPKAGNVPEKIQIDGAEYYCASSSTPIMTKSVKYREYSTYWSAYKYAYKRDRYFLYYTKNKGVAPGRPITEITVSDEVFENGKATALCANSTDGVTRSQDGRKTTGDKAKPYGESTLPTFIHCTYEKGENTFFDKVYTASGATAKEAQAKLLEQGCTEFMDMNLNEGASLTDEDKEQDEKKKGGEYVYFGYRGITANSKDREDQLVNAVYDIVCTVGEPFHPEGIQTDRWQLYYSPVCDIGSDGNASGADLNAGTNGPPIYMYYTTTYAVRQYNKKANSDSRKNLSPEPKDYLKSPITRLCFTRYDRVPYNKDSGVDPQFGDDTRAWEYILYTDSKTPVDFNDGAVKLNSDLSAENNKITMFAQREDGSVKQSAEITGGYVSGKAEYGEMWID